MNITILTYGSRGDVQPFLALACGLQERGHVVKLAAPLFLALVCHSSFLVWRKWRIRIFPFQRNFAGPLITVRFTFGPRCCLPATQTFCRAQTTGPNMST
ncbi:MAG: glycosyltransferase [Anaerolineales bacterium]|nr:glycosyltransferase [Anaerolineales bacterium]MBK9602986.1 glycosyltransferase [Anaerolineales bacterium]